MSKINVTVESDNAGVLCPECGSKMMKHGPGVSGRKEYQRYRCPNHKCYRTWLNMKERYIRKQG